MIGFLTSSTEDMTTSPAFLTIFTQIFGQGAVVAFLHSAVLDQVNLTNSIDSDYTYLMQKLIALPSIITKSNKNGKQIVGHLFHSIIPT